MRRDRILLIYTNYSSFVRGDFEILNSAFRVEKYHFNNLSKFNTLISLFKITAFIAANFFKIKLVYIWFADYHSFVPVFLSKLFGYKSVVVAGGYDVSHNRRYNYGSFNKVLRGCFTIYSFRHSNLVIAVSYYVDRILNSIAPKAKIKTIYNGVNLVKQQYDDQIKSKVICVARVSSKQTFYIKGIDRFINVAFAMDSKEFILIGSKEKLLKSIFGELPKNLKVIENVEHEEMVKFYNQCAVYCQFSRNESFGLALAESMSFGAIPVCSNTGGMIEVVGDCGIVLNDCSVDSTIEGIERAFILSSNKNNREKCQNRIETNFSLEIRKNIILDSIYQLIKKDR